MTEMARCFGPRTTARMPGLRRSFLMCCELPDLGMGFHTRPITPGCYQCRETHDIGCTDRGWLVTAERPEACPPAVGDLICHGRGWAASLRYDDLPTAKLFPSHCDIVVDAPQPGVISVIGGNINDAVTLRHIPVTADGKLARPDGVVAGSESDLDGRALRVAGPDGRGVMMVADEAGLRARLERREPIEGVSLTEIDLAGISTAKMRRVTRLRWLTTLSFQMSCSRGRKFAGCRFHRCRFTRSDLSAMRNLTRAFSRRGTNRPPAVRSRSATCEARDF